MNNTKTIFRNINKILENITTYITYVLKYITLKNTAAGYRTVKRAVGKQII